MGVERNRPEYALKYNKPTDYVIKIRKWEGICFSSFFFNLKFIYLNLFLK